MNYTTEAVFKDGSIIKASEKNNGECIVAEYKGEEFILVETKGADDRNPYLYVDGKDCLHLYWNTLLASTKESSQVKHISFDRNLKPLWQDAIYVRLGGCFTDSRKSSGIDLNNEPFSKALIKRYNQWYENNKLWYNDVEWKSFISEKKKMCNGSILGHIDYTGIYPHTRRIGWCVCGYPFENNNKTYLSLYSYPLQCAVIASSENLVDWDFSEPVVSFGKELNKLELSENDNLYYLKSEKFTAVSKDLYSWTVAVTCEKKALKLLESGLDKFDHDCNYGVIDWTDDEEYHSDSEVSMTYDEMLKINGEVTKPIKGLEDYKTPVIEDIFPLIFEHTHGSGITQLPDGELFAVWFNADGERRAADGRVMAARKPVGKGWTKPFVLANTKGIADINPAVFVDDRERLWFFWYPVISTDWETSQTKYRYAEKGHYMTSDGYCEQPQWDWQDIMYPIDCNDFRGQAVDFKDGEFVYGEKCGVPKYISEEQFKEHPLSDSEYVKIDDKYFTDGFVVELTRGMVNAGKYIEKENFYGEKTPELIKELQEELMPRCRVGTGADNKYNPYNPIDRVICWQTKNKPLQFDFNGKHRIFLPLYCDRYDCSMAAFTDDYGKTWQYSQPISSTGNIQAATVVKKDGTLRSYFRNSAPNDNLVYQESSDGGKTWGTAVIDFELTHDGGFDIVKLKNGKWVMSLTENIYDGDKKYDRAIISIIVSDDEGKTWTRTPLEKDVTGNTQFHYSSIIEGNDENIYITYSHDNTNDRLSRNNIRMVKIEKK